VTQIPVYTADDSPENRKKHNPAYAVKTSTVSRRHVMIIMITGASHTRENPSGAANAREVQLPVSFYRSSEDGPDPQWKHNADD